MVLRFSIFNYDMECLISQLKGMFTRLYELGYELPSRDWCSFCGWLMPMHNQPLSSSFEILSALKAGCTAFQCRL